MLHCASGGNAVKLGLSVSHFCRKLSERHDDITQSGLAARFVLYAYYFVLLNDLNDAAYECILPVRPAQVQTGSMRKDLISYGLMTKEKALSNACGWS